MKLPKALIFTSILFSNILFSSSYAQYLRLPEQASPNSEPVIREAPITQTPLSPPVDEKYMPRGLEIQSSSVPLFAQPPVKEYTAPTKETTGEVVLLNPPVEAPFAYISGGIGADEVEAMKAQKDNYNLHIMSADKAGFFTGEFKITIKDAKGATLFASDAGPLFYAKLANGTYNITGERNGVVKAQKVNIAAGKPAHVHFGW